MMTNQSDTAFVPRSVETEIEIAAPVEAVWRALTVPEELARWFAFEAEVEPRVGGAMELRWWDMCFNWKMVIEDWEPNRHLRTSYTLPYNIEGAEAPRLVVDYFLEARGGATYLRLAHSGFGSAEGWDNEYHGVRRGWQYELRSLRHYLENHAGTVRRVALAVVTLELPWDEVWTRLMSEKGFLNEGSIEGLKEGDRYSIRTAAGHAFTGAVQVLNAGMDFAGTVDNLNGALLRIHIEDVAEKGRMAVAWVATYGLPEGQVAELQAGLNSLLHGLF